MDNREPPQETQQTPSQPTQPVIIINNTPPTPPETVKNKWIAFLLCLFLGTIGAHQYYCGWIGKGIIMTVLTLTGIGAFVTGLWALVNLIQILIGNFHVKDGPPV